MSTLFSIGSSALLANQRALSTTGHNIANANTEGYSRQGVDFAARQVAGQNYGQGVDIANTRRYADAFANQRLMESQSEYGALQTSADLATRLDALMSDEDTGLATPLRDFLGSLDAWAADPGSVESRVEVIGDAEALAQRFTQLQSSVDDIATELNSRTTAAVDRVNELSESIARINDEISYYKGVNGGVVSNDLLDQRDRLVGDLAKEVDVFTTEQGDGSLNVFVGNGQALVVGADASRLDAVPGATPGLPTRVFLGGGEVGPQITGGELGGLQEFRNDVLDPSRQQLQALSDNLAAQVNNAQASGTDLNGNAGQPLFDASPQGAGLEVVISEPRELAAAGPGLGANSGDNSNVLAMAAALRGPVVGQNSAQEANIALVGRLGSMTRSLQAAETAQGALVDHNQNIRDDISGVNLDEEAANLLRYQQAYQAAAQIISVADEMFQSLLAAAR